MATKSITTLILTEDEISGHLIRQLLESSGYQAQVINADEMMLNAVRANPRVMAVVDDKQVSNPWVETVKKLHSLNRFMVIILMVHNIHSLDWKQYFEAGIDFILPLPSKSEEMLDTLEKGIEKPIPDGFIAHKPAHRRQNELKKSTFLNFFRPSHGK